jgi:DUF1680 family protein
VGASTVFIDAGFWAERRALNRFALLSQWEQYERTGTIENFRIAAGLSSRTRQGFFYTDSDLHKWADAASRFLRSEADARLTALLGESIALMTRCQEPDGYLFTYNQIHFPRTRWKNLLLEHELYCHGHFIEAGLSHFEATGGRELLGLAERAADLIVRDFREAGPGRTSGHQEIEIALIRLFRVTGTPAYLDTARNLLERRGRMSFFWLHFLAQTVSHLARSRAVRRRDTSGGAVGFELGENLGRREPPFIMLRSLHGSPAPGRRSSSARCT